MRDLQWYLMAAMREADLLACLGAASDYDVICQLRKITLQLASGLPINH
jgi:hypothetical protein